MHPLASILWRKTIVFGPYIAKKRQSNGRGVVSLSPTVAVGVLMTISNEPILCILIVSIFNMFFHMVKVLEIIFKMSGC